MEEQVNQANLPPCLTSDSGSHIPHHEMYENSCHVVRSKQNEKHTYLCDTMEYIFFVYTFNYICIYRLIIGKSIQNNITRFPLQFFAFCKPSAKLNQTSRRKENWKQKSPNSKPRLPLAKPKWRHQLLCRGDFGWRSMDPQD